MCRLVYFITFVQINSAIIPGNKPDYAIKRQSRSIFSGQTQSGTITPAPYLANIKYDNSASPNFMPTHYFPAIQYPINIFEASKPFYAGTGENNAFLSSFPSDVANNFNSFGKTTNTLTENTYKQSGSISNGLSTTQTTVSSSSVSDNSTNKNSNVNNVVSDIIVLNSSTQDGITKNEVEIINDTTPETQTQLSRPETVLHEDMVKSDKLTEPEPEPDTNEIYDVYYEDDSADNSKTLYNDEVETFYSSEDFSNTNDDGPLNASVAEDTEDTDMNQTNIVQDTNTEDSNSSSSSSSSEKEEFIEQSTSIVEPDAGPLKISTIQQNSVTKPSVPKKITKKIGLGPIQNVKQRKFMKYLFDENLFKLL